MKGILVLTILFIGVTIGVGVFAIKKGLRDEKVKTILGVNISSFFLLMVGTTIFLLSGNTAAATDVVEAALASSMSTGEGLKYIGAALSTGMATIGAGIAVAASGAAAIGAISEDPKLLGKTVIFVGLAEGIAIYGLIISILILR